MTIEKAIAIHKLLVEIGGAECRDEMNFVHHHTCDELCDEWRFMGKLGFGGKYWRLTNRVTCYREDETPERLEIIKILNTELAKL